MIEIRGLTRRFGEFVAVHDLNLHVPKGVIFGFLGPNGSGKSTTVKMLTGILKPSSGDALIDGLSIQNSPLEIKRKIGVLPEDLALFDSLTIWEHLKLCGPIYGLSSSETEARAEQLLNYLDLWSDRHTFVEQASFGMKKKVRARDGADSQSKGSISRRTFRGDRSCRVAQHQGPAHPHGGARRHHLSYFAHSRSG